MPDGSKRIPRRSAHRARPLLLFVLYAPACLQALGDYETQEVEGLGTTLCEADGDCPLFLSCEKPPGASTGMCTWTCEDACDAPTTCVNERCVVPCALQADCPPDFQCVDLGNENGCVPAVWTSGAGTCGPEGCGVMPCKTVTSDYSPGLCAVSCIADACPAGSTCVLAYGLGESCLSTCAPGRECPAGMHCVRATTEAVDVCVPTPWLAQSATHSCTGGDCPVVDCVELEDTYSGVCAEDCMDVADCSPGKRCIMGPGLGPSCLLDCSSDPLICDPLTCLTLTDGTKICAPEAWGG